MSVRRVSVTAKWYALFATGFALFTIYGSLIPFEYVPRTWDDALGAWNWVCHNRIYYESRSDFAANALLGFPLGFCLLGALRLDRKGLATTIAVAVLLTPLCIAFAAAVEFSQLWFPKRTCAISDVIAQSLGSIVGMSWWIVCGQWLTNYARQMWESPTYGGRVSRALVAYVILLFIVETLPWDITASPADWYRKVFRGGVTYQPFQEWNDPKINPLEKMRAWMELVALFSPVGLLMSILPGLFQRWKGIVIVAFCAMVLGLFMESAQIPIVTRHPSVTDILIDMAAVVMGWMVGVLVNRHRVPLIFPLLYWLVFLAVGSWWPLNFDPSIVADRVHDASFLPFISLESKNYLFWLEEIAVKAIVFAPVGAAASRKGVFRATIVAATVGLTLEMGQLMLPGRFPSLTDVILAAAGGWYGAVVARAVVPHDEPIDLEISK